MEAGSHYPIQALQQSLMVQVAQQQQQQTVALDPVFQFPALAAQVSALQQAQAPPAHHPSELDLVYHAAAPQDVSLSQYNVTNAPQAQVYTQTELNPAYHTLNPAAPTMDGGTTVQQQVAAAAAHMTQAPPTYSQQEQYFTNGLVQAATTAQQHPLLQQSNPEITPSPPPQPPIPPHGAPIAYHNGEVGVGTGGGPINNLTSSVEYLKSVAALHRQQQATQGIHHSANHHHHHLSYADKLSLIHI